MKKKALLTSALTILLCVSIIAGSTFALFTDKTDFNIAVTSGDVEIVAQANVTGLYSAVGAEKADDQFLVDEHGKNYTHVLQTNGYFSNGGTVKSDKNRGLVIERITPGDRVDLNIAVDNKSDVAISYRYIITASNDNLARGMVVTVDGTAYESLKSWTSEWYSVVPAPDGKPYPIADKPISIELPVYAGNTYQTEYNSPSTDLDDVVQTVSYQIIVEAVQGNAVTDNEKNAIVYPTQVATELAIANAAKNGGTVTLKDGSFTSPDGFYVNNAPFILDGAQIDAKYAGPSLALIAAYEAGVYLDLSLNNHSSLKTDYAEQYTVFAHNAGDTNASHKISIDASSSIYASGNNSACIFVQFTNCDIYLKDADALVNLNGAYAISATGNAHITIHVPNSSIKAQVERNLATSGYLNIDDNSSVTVKVVVD